MRTSFAILALLLGACGRRSNEDTLDTAMVFIPLPPPSAADSAQAPSKDSALATLRAYRQNRITADQAAPILLDYGLVGGTLDTRIEPELQRAMSREMLRRMGRH